MPELPCDNKSTGPRQGNPPGAINNEPAAPGKKAQRGRREGAETAYNENRRLPQACGGVAAKETDFMAQPKRGAFHRVFGPGKYIFGLAAIAVAAWYWYANSDAAA